MPIYRCRDCTNVTGQGRACRYCTGKDLEQLDPAAYWGADPDHAV